MLNISLKDPTGLPSPDALQEVEGYALLRTDRNGWIEVGTNDHLLREQRFSLEWPHEYADGKYIILQYPCCHGRGLKV